MFGENNLIKTAENSTERYEIARMQEELELEIANIRINKAKEGKEMKREYLLELKEKGVEIDKTDEPTKIEYQGNFFEIDENYKVTPINNKVSDDEEETPPNGKLEYGKQIISCKTSGYYANNIPENMFDGNSETYYQYPAYSAQIELKFDKAYMLSHIEYIQSVGPSSPATTIIYGYTNKECTNKVKIGEKSNEMQQGVNYTISLDFTKEEYYGLVINMSTPRSWSGIYELEIR